MRNLVQQTTAEDHEEVKVTKEADDHKKVKITKRVEDEAEVLTKEADDNSPGFLSSIAIYISTSIIRGFNNLFVQQDAAVLPGGDYLATHPGDPSRVVELDTPSISVSLLAGVNPDGCG